MSPSATILVVEDKDSEREALARLLRLEDYEVITVASAEEANQHLDDHIDMVISDLRMGRASGVDLLRFWKERRRHVPFVMITAHGEVDSAVRAMKLGAEDYLSKPVNPDELLMLVRKCLESARKDETIQLLQHRLDQRLGFENIIGQSKTMINVFENARRAAMVNSTVVITGESGTGKELIAEAIHQNSPRKKGPFVTVNMAAVPEQLVESELFGHTKGAFTGATESREGRFEAADKGTIFIDEIGDFAIESQAKLLRVLENHKVTPVGSNRDREVDVRVVAATSRNLEKMVEDETFRKDLYYRLHVVTLHLPSLRERREDIPLLINHFMREHSTNMEVEPLQISPDLREYLEAHDWPGNVRQLRNCLESMIVLSRDKVLTLDDLPAMVEHGPSTSQQVQIPEGTTLDDLEKEAVEQALERHGGNRTHAARSLKISVRTLQRKLKVWGLDSESQATTSAHWIASNR
jgi:DNA-binding NtrC family response regulator